MSEICTAGLCFKFPISSERDSENDLYAVHTCLICICNKIRDGNVALEMG